MPKKAMTYFEVSKGRYLLASLNECRLSRQTRSYSNVRNWGAKLPLTKVVSAVLPPSEPGGSSAFS